MAQEWTKPPEDTELQDVEQPVGSDDDLDDGGYDATDDPASREPAGSLPPSRDPAAGPPATRSRRRPSPRGCNPSATERSRSTG